MAVTGTIDLISETTGKRIANALEDYQLDGTPETYRREMRRFFINNGAENTDSDKLTALVDQWYSMTRDDWNGWVDFYQPDVSAVSTGTKGGDNAELSCTPSTDTVAGQDDYAGLPLFACVDCNWIVDPDTLKPVITAIDGISGNFHRYDPEIFVGVLQMAGWYWFEDHEDTYQIGYSARGDVRHKAQPLPDAVNPDGTVRSWVVHSKYMSKTVNSKMTCCSGNIPTAWQSHNTTHTLSAATGSQYSGTTTADDTFLRIMAMIKYGSLTMDGIMQGCLNMNYMYYAQAPNENSNVVYLSTANGANLEVGMGVLVGYYNASASSPADRGTAAVYSVSGQAGCLITDIEEVEIEVDEEMQTFAAVTLDLDPFDSAANGSATDGTTMISSFHWPTGTTDGVLGNDGSYKNNTSGKYPYKLQGIEIMNGAYEIFADVILQLKEDDDGICYYKPYIVRQSSLQATSISGNYVETGLKIKDEYTEATYTYIKKNDCKKGVFFPCECGGSSSTYTRDSFRMGTRASDATREWLARGSLSLGVANGGLSCVRGDHALSTTYWYCASRLSACGNRGEWAA